MATVCGQSLSTLALPEARGAAAALATAALAGAAAAGLLLADGAVWPLTARNAC